MPEVVPCRTTLCNGHFGRGRSKYEVGVNDRIQPSLSSSRKLLRSGPAPRGTPLPLCGYQHPKCGSRRSGTTWLDGLGASGRECAHAAASAHLLIIPGTFTVEVATCEDELFATACSITCGTARHSVDRSCYLHATERTLMHHVGWSCAVSWTCSPQSRTGTRSKYRANMGRVASVHSARTCTGCLGLDDGGPGRTNLQYCGGVHKPRHTPGGCWKGRLLRFSVNSTYDLAAGLVVK